MAILEQAQQQLNIKRADHCSPILNKRIEAVDNLEVMVFNVAAKEPARELSVITRDLLAYRRIVRPQIEALELLERKEYPFLKVDPDVYLILS